MSACYVYSWPQWLEKAVGIPGSSNKNIYVIIFKIFLRTDEFLPSPGRAMSQSPSLGNPSIIRAGSLELSRDLSRVLKYFV